MLQVQTNISTHHEKFYNLLISVNDSQKAINWLNISAQRIRDSTCNTATDKYTIFSAY